MNQKLQFEDHRQSTSILTEIVSGLQSQTGYQSSIKKTAANFKFSKSHLSSLTPQKVLSLFKHISHKRNSQLLLGCSSQKTQSCSWFENQLRIFVWIICALLILEKKRPCDLTQEDYQVLHQIFPHKPLAHLEYQVRLLIRNKNIKWTQSQSDHLQAIMSRDPDSRKWNAIATQLYVTSDRAVFKTPKQCRERWINYIDERKVKGQWMQSEDMTLLREVNGVGKRWTHISKILGDTRTQNCVKNRFNSLIKAGRKRYQEAENEQDIILLLLNSREHAYFSSQELVDENLRGQYREESWSKKQNVAEEGEKKEETACENAPHNSIQVSMDHSVECAQNSRVEIDNQQQSPQELIGEEDVHGEESEHILDRGWIHNSQSDVDLFISSVIEDGCSNSSQRFI